MAAQGPGAASGTTVREGGAAAAGTPTQREGEFARNSNAAPARPRVNLPDEVAARYEFVRDLAVRSGESDVSLVRDRETGEELVFKYYRFGISPDQSAMRALMAADNRHVAHIVDFHSDAQGAWEIQEYYPLGTLRDLLGERPVLAEKDRLAVVSEISEALDHMQGLSGGVAHRDLKPSNIFIRERNPLDLVLADFGLAQVQHGLTHLTQTAQGTWHYAAPEVHDREASPKSDWFSLGAIVYELCTGRRLLSSPNGEPLSDHDAMTMCVKGAYSSQLVEDERWRMLVDGLTTYDRDHRWGYEEVASWLGGGSPAVFQGSAVSSPRPSERGRFGYQPDWFPGLVHNPAEYAEALRGHWEKAAADWMGRPNSEAMQFLEPFGLAEGAGRIIRLGEHPDSKFVRLQVLFDPDGDVVFHGLSLTSESLRRQIELCQQGNIEAQDWLMEVYESDVLMALAEMTDDAKLARAAYYLHLWKGQAKRVLQLVPDERRDFALRVVRLHMGELFVSAFERAEEQHAAE